MHNPVPSTDLNTDGVREAPRTRITARPYEKHDEEPWERLVAESWNGTFLHQRKFLSYHGNRFQDLPLFIEDETGRIAGVFPAGLDPNREDRVEAIRVLPTVASSTPDPFGER